VRQSWLITITLAPAHSSPLMGTGSDRPRPLLYNVMKKSRTSGIRSFSAVCQGLPRMALGSITNESSTKDFVSIPGGLGDGGDSGGDGGDGGDGGGGVGGVGGAGGGGSSVGGSIGIGMATTTSATTELTELDSPMPAIIAELIVIAELIADIAAIARRWAVVATAGDPASATK